MKGQLDLTRFGGHLEAFTGGAADAATAPACPPEFRRRMVEFVRSGRTPEELSRAFGPTARSIAKWARQADRDAGARSDGVTSVEREELARLRRELRAVRQERDILAKAAAWFARESRATPGGRLAERALGRRHHLRADGGGLSMNPPGLVVEVADLLAGV